MEFTLKPETIEALKAVREAIGIDGGRSFNMSHWGIRTKCGTTCCIAGHLALMRGFVPVFDKGYASPTKLLSGERVMTASMFTDGKEIAVASGLVERFYGIPDREQRELFYASSWPRDLYLRFRSGDKLAAQEAIDRFIAKYAPEPVAQPVCVAEEV